MLLDSGVEVHQVKAQFIADGKVYGPGSFVVSMAQPKGGLVRWMLGRTFYPDNSYTRDREGNPIRPYDMSTDTFGEFMGVRCDPIGETITADLDEGDRARAARRHRRGERDERLRAEHEAERQLPRRQPAAREGCDGAPRAARDGFTPGDFIVAGSGDAAVAEVAKQTGVTFTALAGAAPADAYEVRKPRIAMYQRYGGGNMDEGWTRLMFEQFNVPVHVAHGRRDQERRPQRQLRRHRPAGRFGGGDDRASPREPAVAVDEGGGGGAAPVGGRQHAARVSQRLRRRRRQGPAGVRRRRAARW